MDEETPVVARLAMDDGGLWAVRSTSATVYFLDLDNQLLLRAPGPGSSTGPFDGIWVHLVSIESATDEGVVAVGRRHRYTMDPDPGGPGDLLWWIPRAVTAIDPVSPERRPDGRPAAAAEYATPFTYEPRGSVPPTPRPPDRAASATTVHQAFPRAGARSQRPHVSPAAGGRPAQRAASRAAAGRGRARHRWRRKAVRVTNGAPLIAVLCAPVFVGARVKRVGCRQPFAWGANQCAASDQAAPASGVRLRAPDAGSE